MIYLILVIQFNNFINVKINFEFYYKENILLFLYSNESWEKKLEFTKKNIDSMGNLDEINIDDYTDVYTLYLNSTIISKIPLISEAGGTL